MTKPKKTKNDDTIKRMAHQYAVSEWYRCMTNCNEENDADLERIIESDREQSGVPFYKLAKDGFLAGVQGDTSLNRFVEAYNRYAIAKSAFLSGHDAAKEAHLNIQGEA
jgi:hypothetical protein